MRRVATALFLGALTLVTGVCHSADPNAEAKRAEYLESIRQAKALYEDRCAKVAGEKIYKTVDNVEGVLLLNIPAMGTEREWFQRDFPGAAFAHARAGGMTSFVQEFLWYERYGENPPRGLTTEKTPLPGYRYVDVVDEQDGKRYRYTGSMTVTGKKDVTAVNVRLALAQNPDYDLSVYNWVLTKTPVSGPSPRYGIRFEDHVIPEERALWVASGTIKVVDLQTKQVLGEMTRYAMATSRPGPGASPPWLRTHVCGGETLHDPARLFVDQVLKPSKGDKK